MMAGPPQKCLLLPDHFTRGLTCLWLCRTDKVELHRLPPVSMPDDTAILTLLATQPDPEP